MRNTALTNAEITPKNRHYLRGLDGKYGRWDEILRDILNGKLKIVQNRKVSVSETEDEDDDDDEEMPEEIGSRTYDTSQMVGTSRFEPTPWRMQSKSTRMATKSHRVRTLIINYGDLAET